MTVAVVVGGGIMGGGIALALARTGNQVTVVEPNSGASVALAARFSDSSGVGAHLMPSITTELSPVIDADLVIEAAPEDLDLKRRLWTRLGELAPESAILASNTSSLDIELLAERVPDPSRVLAVHWFNPAYEVECVEVAPGKATAPHVIENVLALLRAAGKSPVVVPNVAGFVANRIQFAAVREAMLCVQEGISAEDVDEIVRKSFAPRLAAAGPLASADFGGLDTYLSIFEVLQGAYGERFAPPPVLRESVDHARLGLKSGEGFFDYREMDAEELIGQRDRVLSQVISAVREVRGAAADRRATSS